MIARIWHGRTTIERAEEYLQYLNETGIPDYRETPGNSGAYVLRRIEGDIAHFQTVSFWESIESIKQFDGEDCERARYYPRDEEFLLELEPKVKHFELFGADDLVGGCIKDAKEI